MVQQCDIIIVDVDPTRGTDKGKNRPCVLVSNNLVHQNSSLVWALPITSRESRYATDIHLKTKKGKVQGIIDSVQIRAIDIQARGYKIVDQLQDQLRVFILKAIEAHVEVTESSFDKKFSLQFI